MADSSTSSPRRAVRDGLPPERGHARAARWFAPPARLGRRPRTGRFHRRGAALVVTERGRDAVVMFPVLPSGHLADPVTTPSAGPTPSGFAATGHGGLVVTGAAGAQIGKAAASSYRIDAGGLTAETRSLGNGRSEICWAVATPDGRHAFTTNFADGAVSAWDVQPDGALSLRDATPGLTQDGRKGLRDEALTPDAGFLNAIDADSHEIVGWSVNTDGELTSIGSWGELPVAAAGL